jgi:radical SAM protein with 4Fe4S-binding SPASM domain
MIKYTELKSTGRQDLMEVLPLAKPFTVLIEPSSLCNFHCVQCFQSIKEPSYFTENRMHMPMERFKRVVRQLRDWPGAKLKVLKLSLYGEPLLHPEFGSMLRLAREADIAERIETTTNASLLTRDVAEALVDGQLDYVRVSIYSADSARHRRITRSPMSTEAIHENLRVLQEVKRTRGSNRPFVSCKMLDAYGDENQRFEEMYRDVADEVFLDKPHSWIKIEGADFIDSYYEEEAGEARRDLKRHSSARVACPMAFTTMAVRSNGAVSPCCVDFIGGTNLGSVEENSLKSLWKSDAWYEFQKMQLEDRKRENPSCARCDIYLSDHYTRDDIDDFPVERLR